jgi:hypothetical protein
MTSEAKVGTLTQQSGSGGVTATLRGCAWEDVAQLARTHRSLQIPVSYLILSRCWPRRDLESCKDLPRAASINAGFSLPSMLWPTCI